MADRESTTRDEEAHDVLAAEEFGVPAADPELHHGPLVVPEDPSGIAEPHDVLAADEFPMPAVRPHPAEALAKRPGGSLRILAEVLAVLAIIALVRRRRRA